ncbi:MAG: hypothetical protein AB7F86_04255 [Bdellovibrionales bacterium]
MKTANVAAIFAALIFFFSPAHASVKVVNGTVTINVSGADGYYSGSDGSSAGQVNLNLAYADAAKTVVKLTGTAVHGGRTENINEQIPLSNLEAIKIYAIGGDGAQGQSGYSGSSGRDGQDGRDGYPGSDGCPPGNGSNGEDGGNGTNGEDGGAGGNGGDGGNGGTIRINTSPEESELMLFVQTSVRSGSGGSGGYGGSGGSGGRGGRGGRGGSGGRNTCTDSTGKPIPGPDGSSGWDGRDGSSGYSGSSGRSGWDGGRGRTGSKSFNLVSASGTQSFSSPFELEVSNVTFVDDLTDSVLQPGERLHLTSVTISNRSGMPSPAGQNIQLTLESSPTLIPLSPPLRPMGPIGSSSSSTLTFAKGAATLQVPHSTDLLGKKALVKAKLGINGVKWDVSLDSGMAVRWPASLSTGSSRINGLFEVAKSTDFTLKNVGSQPLGPGGPQPVRLQFNWSSKKIPAQDVFVSLANGQVFRLDQPAVISDLTVPANSVAVVPVQMVVRDRALLESGSGTLTASLRMKDPTSGQDIVQSLEIPVNMDLDIRAIEWNQTVSFARTHVQCLFPRGGGVQPLAYVQVAKASGSSQMQVRLAVARSANALSPVITVSASKMLSYYEQFADDWTGETATEFLNKLISPASPEGLWSFRSCELAP